MPTRTMVGRVVVAALVALLLMFTACEEVIDKPAPPPDTAPTFAGTVPVTDQTYQVGTSVNLSLPAAAGGNGALTYSLQPAVPGLAFDPATRALNGRPTVADAYFMTYTAVDGDSNRADNDAATLTFTITVLPDTEGLCQQTASIPADRIIDYLQTHTNGGPWVGGTGFYRARTGLATWDDPPILRISEGESAELYDFVLWGVDVINKWLPSDNQIRIGPPAPPLTDAQLKVLKPGQDFPNRLFIEDIPDGEIFVTSIDADILGTIANVINQRVQDFDPEDGRSENVRMRRARLWITPRLLAHASRRGVLFHELVHAMGMLGHIPAREGFTDSVMANDGVSWNPETDDLPRIDGEGLLAAYTRFEPGTDPKDITVEALGSWTGESLEAIGLDC